MRPETNRSNYSPSLDDDSRWQAVCRRDASYNGLFYYGVRSTGVFCRPACSARRPRRDRIVFFETCEDARKAGFRPCLRCRPADETADPEATLIARACRMLEESSESPLQLADLSARLGVSPYHLQRTFKAAIGVTPRQYAAARRVGSFKDYIRSGRSVSEAIYHSGYGSSSRLYEEAARSLGMTPAAYRRGGKGERIVYATVSCHLGRMLVAATGRGVCAISFGEDDEALIGALLKEYPAAEISSGEDHLKPWIEELLEHLAGLRPRLDLPLDLQATSFQLRVWEALRQIPYGETRSYRMVAAAIDAPTAVRAVARACASNPVALANPCHRAIREDGHLGGYRWGLERKRQLLEKEASRPKSPETSR